MIKQLAVFCLLVSLAPAVAMGHGEMMQSTPKSGASLSAVPEAVVLNFTESVRVTAISLERDGEEAEIGWERDLTPTDAVTVPLLEQSPGRYRLDWRALGADGHPMSGSLEFTVTAE